MLCYWLDKMSTKNKANFDKKIYMSDCKTSNTAASSVLDKSFIK